MKKNIWRKEHPLFFVFVILLSIGGVVYSLYSGMKKLFPLDIRDVSVSLESSEGSGDLGPYTKDWLDFFGGGRSDVDGSAMLNGMTYRTRGVKYDSDNMDNPVLGSNNSYLEAEKVVANVKDWKKTIRPMMKAELMKGHDVAYLFYGFDDRDGEGNGTMPVVDLFRNNTKDIALNEWKTFIWAQMDEILKVHDEARVEGYGEIGEIYFEMFNEVNAEEYVSVPIRKRFTLSGSASSADMETIPYHTEYAFAPTIYALEEYKDKNPQYRSLIEGHILGSNISNGASISITEWAKKLYETQVVGQNLPSDDISKRIIGKRVIDLVDSVNFHYLAGGAGSTANNRFGSFEEGYAEWKKISEDKKMWVTEEIGRGFMESGHGAQAAIRTVVRYLHEWGKAGMTPDSVRTIFWGWWFPKENRDVVCYDSSGKVIIGKKGDDGFKLLAQDDGIFKELFPVGILGEGNVRELNLERTFYEKKDYGLWADVTLPNSESYIFRPSGTSRWFTLFVFPKSSENAGERFSVGKVVVKNPFGANFSSIKAQRILVDENGISYGQPEVSILGENIEVRFSEGNISLGYDNSFVGEGDKEEYCKKRKDVLMVRFFAESTTPNQKPTANIVSPQNDTVFSPGKKIEFNGSVTDDSGDNNVMSKEWRKGSIKKEDGNKTVNCFDKGEENLLSRKEDWKWWPDELDGGEYGYCFRARDDYGLWSDWASVIFTVSGNNKPVLAITSPKENPKWISRGAGSYVRISGTATDRDRGDKVTKYLVATECNNTKKDKQIASGDVKDGKFTFDWYPNLTESGKTATAYVSVRDNNSPEPGWSECFRLEAKTECVPSTLYKGECATKCQSSTKPCTDKTCIGDKVKVYTDKKCVETVTSVCRQAC